MAALGPAVQATRQAILIAAALLLARLLLAWQIRRPFLLAFVATFALFTLLLEQSAGRVFALLWPERSHRLLLGPARWASAPAAALLGLLRRPLERPGRHREVAAGADVRSGESEVSGAPAGERIQLQQARRELIENVMEFSDTLVREVMTPRTDMFAAPETASLSDLVALVARANRSRILITRGGADNVIGMVHARDLLGACRPPAGPGGFADVIRPVITVPETKRAFELLREMQARSLHMAIVVDEYGGTAGLVTIEDLLEELVGEIADEHDVRRPEIVEEGDALLVRGGTPVYDLAERLGVSMPDVEADTVGGLMAALLGRLPETGDTVSVAGLRLDVADADRRRVRRVRVRRLPEAGA